ncbi:MAG: hypothetical protein JWN44_5380 [Myxococcales bacterium]|nr:hypothetical protein [Myxococcales bacterium]
MRCNHLALLALLAGCAATARFPNRAVLWRDPDTLPIARPRAPAPAAVQWAGFRDALLFPADRALSLDYGEESTNVNALDEVPDSSWYFDVRRAGLSDEERARPRALGADGIARGAFGDDPGPVPPFTIIKAKTIGSTPGLVVRDARSKLFMFKLDPPGWLGMNTSTEVVAARLAWASGWIVPAEMIVDVRADELLLSPFARAKDARDEEVPLTAEMLADLVRRTPREADGTIRVCAGRWLDGRSLGPWAYTGRRADDPNDHIEHQNRRDVRAFGVFAAWVNDIDTMENNTMDAYVGSDGSGYVVHYQQDVGGSFGQFAAVPAEVWMGQETFFMPDRIVASLFTFGALARTFDDDARHDRRRRLLEKYPQLGYFDDDGFDPRRWHPVLDNPAFVRMTRRDRYWGAKRVIAFSEAEVRAAIALGHYPPATANRLFEVLWRRREKIARAFLAETAPLDYFRFDDQRLCFDDLWVESGLAGPDAARYFTIVDGARQDGGTTTCVAADASPGYHVLELGVVRTAESRHFPTVRIHYVTDDRHARVVGIER